MSVVAIGQQSRLDGGFHLAPTIVGAEDTGKKEGLFRLIKWESEKAFREAQNFFQRLRSGRKDIGEDEWAKYFSYADEIWENRNVAVLAGLGVFMQAAADLAIAPAAKFGGPAGSTNKTYLGVGNGLVTCTLSSQANAGATSLSISSITGGSISAGDVIILQDATTAQTQGTNVEFAVVLSTGVNTLNLTLPTRFVHAINTYVTRAGAPTDSNLAGGSKTFKGVDGGFPTYTTPSSKATLTWQATYGTAEAQYAWNECLIAAVPAANTPPNAGSGSSGVTTIPGSSTLLAVSVWYPSPLTKGASVISQQYQFSIS